MNSDAIPNPEKKLATSGMAEIVTLLPSLSLVLFLTISSTEHPLKLERFHRDLELNYLKVSQYVCVEWRGVVPVI